MRPFSVLTPLLLSLLICAAAIAGSNTEQTWTNTALSPSQRADALLSQMTLEEQLAMVSGGPKTYIGSIPGNKRLGIPELNFQDGPAGVGDDQSGGTQFPSPVCMAASWDTNMARRYGTYIGEEEHGKGGDVLLGPTMNMARAYQNGRNTESYGEDPFLSSAMALEHIQGVQSQGVMANAKHFVCNDQETDRWLVSADADERTRQEIYYLPFRACVRGGVGVIMASYNRINDRFACESTALNATVKKQWGYDGFIMSDWAAYFSTVGAAQNGLDMDMFNGAFAKAPLSNAISSGNVAMSDLSEKVHRILTMMFRFGLFDNPSKGHINAVVTTPSHAQFARDCAAAGTVLLQNKDALLPFNTNAIHSIAVIGKAASEKPIFTALGSSSVIPPYTISPLAGLKNRAGSAIKIDYAGGEGDIPAAVALAKNSDVAIVCVGEQTGESLDRKSLSLPGDQDALISAVSSVNPHTVVVVYCSSATLMPWSSNVDSILVSWFPGQESGNALASVLFGDVNPSGKLPVTIPAAESEVPANLPSQFPGTRGHAIYSEGLNIGYRWYDAHNVAPRFPFGYGLSFTTFAYTNLNVSPVSPSGQVQIGFDLKNTGNIAGAEVPQLYLGFPAAAGEPPKLLRGFGKVNLQPGETKHVTFNLDWEDLADWDVSARGWLVTPGTFQVMVGSSAKDIQLKGSFNVQTVPASDIANAALHRIATASSILSTNTPARAAVDGDLTTSWSSRTNNPQWLAVDLGMMKDLSRVRLNWGTNYASSYAIQLSPDSVHWTTLASTTNGTGGINDHLVSGRGRFLRLVATQQGIRGSGYSLSELSAYAQPQRPFDGTPVPLPGKIDAVNFDAGGENVGYYNITVGNPGRMYRPDDDIGITTNADASSGYVVGWLNPGEWLEYTVDVPDPEAIYSIGVRTAAASGGGRLRLRLDGEVLGTLDIPRTTGQHAWQTFRLPNVPISGGTGTKVLRLEILNGGFAISRIELNRVELCGTNNTAFQQPSWASSEASSTNRSSEALDGDPRTCWWAKGPAPQSLTVDLGSPQKISRIRLDWKTEDFARSSYGTAAFSQDFNIQFSDDNKTWKSAYATTNGIGGLNDLAVSGSARYVRVNSTQNVNDNGVALYEFEVYPAISLSSKSN